MTTRPFTRLLHRILALSCLLILFARPGLGDKKEPELEVPFEPTPPQVLDAMLKLGKVTASDYVFDLGCGDGRILIAAAKTYGARGYGVDLDPQRIEECKENAEAAGVADKLTFKLGDIFDAQIGPATIVTTYLLDEINLKLRPKYFRELKPGTRIVSHCFDMADWKADKEAHPSKARGQLILFWVIPAPVGGSWHWTEKSSTGEREYRLDLEQKFQTVTGTLTPANGTAGRITAATLNGKEFSFSATVPDGKRQARMTFKGTADGDTIKGTQLRAAGGKSAPAEWVAKRDAVDLAGAWRIKAQDSPEPLAGLLKLQRKDGALHASFVGDADKKEVALPQFIVWGASIYFEGPAAGDADRGPIFTGSLRGDAGTGRVEKTGWSKKPAWTAQREK